MSEKEKKFAHTPLSYLNELIAKEGIPLQVKVDAAKAILPYTAKKTADTLETISRSYVIKDERLAGLTDEQITTLIDLVRQVAEPRDSGTGTAEAEVQHDK